MISAALQPLSSRAGGWGASFLQEAAQRGCGIHPTCRFPQAALPPHASGWAYPAPRARRTKLQQKCCMRFHSESSKLVFNCGMRYSYLNHEKSQKSSICFSVSECRNAPRAWRRTGSLVRLTLAGNLWVRIQSLLLAGQMRQSRALSDQALDLVCPIAQHHPARLHIPGHTQDQLNEVPFLRAHMSAL